MFVFVYNVVGILIVVGMFYLFIGMFLLLVIVVGVMVFLLVSVIGNVLWLWVVWL